MSFGIAERYGFLLVEHFT